MEAASRKTGFRKLTFVLTGVLALLLLAPGWADSSILVEDGGTTTISSDVTNYYEVIGYAAHGTLNHIGGNNTVVLQSGDSHPTIPPLNPSSNDPYQLGGSGYLVLGYTSTGTGNYNLSGTGSLSAPSEYVGFLGTGSFTQSGGTNAATSPLSGLLVGAFSGSSGGYNLSGGSLSAPNEYVGAEGTGAFIQSGGTNTVNGLELGYSSNSSGTYDLSDSGSISAGFEHIGNSGIGVFTQSGGTHTVINTIILAAVSGSSGTYDLQGGFLSTDTIDLNADGIFKQTGGTLEATTFNQQGGEVQGSLENRGTFNYTSGVFTGRLLNYGQVDLFSSSSSFTAGNGLAQYSADPISLGVGKTLTLNGDGLEVDQNASFNQTGGSLLAIQELIGKTGAGIFTQSGGTNTVTGTSTLTLGDVTGGSGTYNLSGGSLSAVDEIIGNAGTGVFGHSGGFNIASGTLTLGNQATTGSGTYTLSNTGSLSSLNEVIGGSGIGVFTQSGGTNSVNYDFILGDASSGRGTYTLSGGSLSADLEIIGDAGTGAFTQNGGHGSNVQLFLARESNSSGTYTLSNGNLTADYEAIGIFDGATGAFTQSGGTHLVTTVSRLGFQGSGTYTLSGGSLAINSTEVIPEEIIGDQGTGVFSQSGGYHTVGGTLTMGNDTSSSGTYALSNTGSLSVTGNEIIGNSGIGAFTQSDGFHTIGGANNLYLGYAAGGSGTYTLNGGSLLVNAYEIVGKSGFGAFTQSGGTNFATTTLSLGNNTAEASGTYNLSSGSLSALNEYIGNNGSGAFTQTGGTNTIIGGENKFVMGYHTTVPAPMI